MRLRLAVDRLTGQRVEWTLEVERVSARDAARYAEADASRYRMALEAVVAAADDDAAALIAREALEDGS